MADAADADRGSRDPELPAWLRAKVETAWNGNGSDRRNQVQSLCRQYPGFVTAIERYVDGIRESDERPTSPPEPATRPVVVLDPLPAAGGPLAERIGPYMVRKKLGEGAFGEVFLADQHHPLRRTVAIKLIRPGMDSDEVVARFTAEREVLALMDHPNIAKIFDAGTDAQKRPYFVMEYVQGEPITRYASDRDLDVDARLRLFRQVCDGIQHAHQKGIIHRDLSARNVLVTEIDGRPTPKVIDFGIAKSMLRPLGDGDVRTLKWQIFGTPEYMSPEQARSSGMDIDVRTDVYALGVLLYELLTGTLPVPSETLRSASPLEWCELIRDAQPPLPSRRAHDARSQLPGLAPRTAALVRRLQGDLDWIVRKAMEPDRAHRYGSAAELAADLDRHLHDEPVTARQPTAGYRLRKFVRKHKTAVLTATAGLCGLLVALIVITRLYLSAEDARGAARRNEQLAAERLEEVLQLADVQRLAELRESAETKLWPAERETVPAMEQWLVEVAALRERLTEHRAQLTKLRTEALPGESTGRVEFRFADTERQWRHDTLQGLVAGIESLVGANGGPSLLAAIETRLAFARDVERRSLVEPAALWQSTIAALGSDPYRARHANVRLTPQLGLVPLGPDPDSGLFEFAHLQTGEVPVRGRDGRLTRTEDTGLVFVLLPGGKFWMGAAQPAQGRPGDPNADPFAHADEGPVHEVEIAPFFLSKYEMTQGQWLRIAGANPSFFAPGRRLGDRPPTLLHPVEQVSHEDCTALLSRLSLRLPTEAQWEYAARGGTDASWSVGATRESLIGAANLADQAAARAGFSWPSIDDWPELDDGYAAHAPVGRFAANPFGLHDIHGNVWEWCRDVYVPYPGGMHGPDGERRDGGNRDRTFRGGSFYGTARQARSADRNSTTPTFRGYYIGVRPARRLSD